MRFQQVVYLAARQISMINTMYVGLDICNTCQKNRVYSFELIWNHFEEKEYVKYTVQEKWHFRIIDMQP